MLPEHRPVILEIMHSHHALLALLPVPGHRDASAHWKRLFEDFRTTPGLLQKLADLAETPAEAITAAIALHLIVTAGIEQLEREEKREALRDKIDSARTQLAQL